jgi:hypothetical protein
MTEGWRVRVEIELAQLQARARDLEHFMLGEEYETLSPSHKVWMGYQRGVMLQYETALTERLKLE